MDGSAVQEIKKIVKESQIIEVEGKKYVPHAMYEVESPTKRPQAVEVNTLFSLVEFAKAEGINNEWKAPGGYFAVISENMGVSIYSGFKEAQDKQRTLVARAKNNFQPFQFDKFYPSEIFNIMLQTRFVYEKGEAIALFQNMSKLQIDEGINLSDDGMTTKITVRRGMSAASLDTEIMKTRFPLAPYRIFPECDQPISDFLVRIKGSKEEGAHIGLWETDGGLWQFQAKSIIIAKLQDYGLVIPIYA